MSRARLFRWVGSKAHLVDALAPALRAELAAGGGRVISLFYGTGALEQAIAPASPQLAAEANPELRCLYSVLVRAPESVFTALRGFDAVYGRTRQSFLRVRALEAEHLPPLERAARFLWLSAMSFNGLWRVDRLGRHNVPPDPARLAKPWPFPSLKQLVHAASDLRGVEFVARWARAALEAQVGDLVISDPPYVGGFEAYTAEGFGHHEQRQLADTLRVLVARGCSLVAFNSPAARQLYLELGNMQIVQRSGRMSSDPSRRQRVSELLVFAGSRLMQWRAA